MGWLQQEINATSRLTFSGGFRYDDYSDFGSEWSPKVNAGFSVAEGHRLHASFGHGFRAPTFGELYLFTPPFFVGNPDLRPERSDTFTGGYSHAGPKAQASVDYFRARVTDGVAFDLSRQPFTYTNVTRYTSSGVNVSLAANLPGGFAPSLAYTYNLRKDASGREIQLGTKHSTVVKVLWANSRLGLRANLRGQLLSKVVFTTDRTSQPAYQIWHAQISKVIATRERVRIRAFVQSDNLFNETDFFRRSPTGEPIPGDFLVWISPRTYLAGLTVDWTSR